MMASPGHFLLLHISTLTRVDHTQGDPPKTPHGLRAIPAWLSTSRTVCQITHTRARSPQLLLKCYQS